MPDNRSNSKPLSSPSKLFLMDAHSLIYRAYFAIRGLSTSKGLPTNAIYGFTNMLLKVLREKQPDYVAVVFDAKGPTQRHLDYQEYKADRPEMPDALQRQLPYIHQVIEAFCIPVILKEGYEADDLIGTIARIAERHGYEVTIVSGDKDMLQLVTPHVQVYDTMKDKIYGLTEVRERFGVGPERIVEVMGLMGDSIDNIPGVPGIGEKTAVALIHKFGTIENLLNHLDQVEKPKLRESLGTSAELARMSRKLATIETDCPVDLSIEQLKQPAPDTERLVRLFRELEFGSLLKTLSVEISTVGEAQHLATPVLNPQDLDAMTATLKSSTRCSIHIWKIPAVESSDMILQILGIGIGSGTGTIYYIPLHHRYPDAPYQLDPVFVLRFLDNFLSNTASLKIVHGAKPLYLLAQGLGLGASRPVFDTQIASYLLHPNRRDYTLETVLFEHLEKPLEKAGLSHSTSLSQMLTRTTEVIPSLFILHDRLLHELSAQGLLDLYSRIELPLTEVLAEMESHGILLNVQALDDLSKEMEFHLSEITTRVSRLAGEEFNINSPKQLSHILFEKLGFKPIKRTKTGYSTNEEVLHQLAFQHELPAEILSYRQLSKLKSTYVDVLPRLVNPKTGRLHTSFNQTGTATGRLSSSEPNLQNIPIKGDFGERIRKAFIASDGYQLLSFDYNQIELRILAHLSQDEKLVAAFREGQDIHTSTAVKIFGLSAHRITPEMRRVAKTVNFGIIYGISAYGLSTTLGISQTEAQQYINSYFSHYQGVKQFIDRTISEACTMGYVTTLFSRRRPIPELTSQDHATRALGERTAVNTVIQGSAADLIKLAMIRIANRMRKDALKVRMLLQIHDELLFEVLEEKLETVKLYVQSEMESVTQLSVPIKVDVAVGYSWGAMRG